MRKITFSLCILVYSLVSCNPVDRGTRDEVAGFVPIYSKDAVVKKITAEPPRPAVKGGKMYTTGRLLFQVEPDSGIHVINYADPQHPIKLGFIRSLLCKEISVKNGYIYTNNFSDLVVIDVNDMNNVREISRVENAFPDLALQYPERDVNNFSTIYFECPDPAKGIIVGWKEEILKKPKCWR